jgi:hypothetical protein
MAFELIYVSLLVSVILPDGVQRHERNYNYYTLTKLDMAPIVLLDNCQ